MDKVYIAIVLVLWFGWIRVTYRDVKHYWPNARKHGLSIKSSIITVVIGWTATIVATVALFTK